MAVILVFGEPIFQDDRGDVLKPERPCIGCALQLVGSDVLGLAAKGIWDGRATGCCGCTNCLPYSRSDHEWIICAAQILEIVGPQLDQIRNKVLEDEVHEVKWKDHGSCTEWMKLRMGTPFTLYSLARHLASALVEACCTCLPISIISSCR